MADHFDTVRSFNNWIVPETIIHSHHTQRVKEIVWKSEQFCCVITFWDSRTALPGQISADTFFRLNFPNCLKIPGLEQQAHQLHPPKEHLDMEWQTWKDQSKIDPTYRQEYLLGGDRHQCRSHHRRFQQVYDEHMHGVLGKVAWFFQILRELKTIFSRFEQTIHDLKNLPKSLKLSFSIS